MKSFSPASALVETLANQGCCIWVTGDKLRISDPERTLTDDLRQAIREHKEALIGLLRTEPANDAPSPCPTCGDLKRWPMDRRPVCPTCWLAARASEPLVAPEWMVQRTLDSETVRAALQGYLAKTPAADTQNVPDGVLLARFNTWLGVQGQQPTTLPDLRQALGCVLPQGPPEPPPYIKRCERCGGTAWGPSGAHADDGAEIWHCLPCNPDPEWRTNSSGTAGWKPVRQRWRI